MENKEGNKKLNIFQISIYVIVVALAVTVFYQGRHINTLNKKIEILSSAETSVDSKTSVAEEPSDQHEKENQIKVQIAEPKNAAESSKDDKTSVVEEPPVQDKKENQDEVQIAESKAEDNTSGQTEPDDVKPEEENKNLLKKVSSLLENPAMQEIARSQLKTMLATTYDAFAEEYNLSPEIQNKLLDIIVEKQFETIDMASQGGDITPEEMKQETEWIEKTYDEKISELLSPEEFSAYKEFAEVEPERMLLNDFKSINYVGDHQIDKEKEKKLIAAMYDERQKMTEALEMNPESGNLNNELALYDSYLKSARTVLSDSEMKNFNDFIDSRKSLVEMAAKMVGNLGQEEDK